MPKERKKRGRREEKKRKREEEEENETRAKRPKSAEGDVDGYDEQAFGDDYLLLSAEPSETPFYGMLDEEEQEYFKRADTMLELNQFSDPEERSLFLANVYKEASGKELKIANSQSCSRLMERLILMSTADQLKALFQKFKGHFIHLVQHRFASHCCETLFVQAAPLVSQDMATPSKDSSNDQAAETLSIEQIFLGTAAELERNLGFLMVDRFASHALRVLLLVFSGRALVDQHTTSLLQSKKKEHITLASKGASKSGASGQSRTVPDSFRVALDQMMKGIVGGLDTTNLRALAAHPIANPLLQLILDLELSQSGKSKAKDPDSLFKRLLPDDPPEEGTESASFFNGMLYDPIGSRLLEVIVTNSPGKMFKVLYRSLFRDRLADLAKNETASYVLVKALERLNKEDLEDSLKQLCPMMQSLLERSRTSVITCLVDRCRVREVDNTALYEALYPTQGKETAENLKKLLYFSTVDDTETRHKHGGNHDPNKAHASLLAQSILEASNPLQCLVTEGILAMDEPTLLHMAKDRNATHVLQKLLTCRSVAALSRRAIMHNISNMAMDLALDAVASHVLDAFWQGSDPESSEMKPFVRERLAETLLSNEKTLRDSVSGRAVWRTWKMDMYKTRRYDWKVEAKGQQGQQGQQKNQQPPKTSLELARERHAAATQSQASRKEKEKKKKGKAASSILTGANARAVLLSAVQELLIPFIRAADEDATVKDTGHGLSTEGGAPRTTLVEQHKPQKLSQLLDPQFPETGVGQEGFLQLTQKILQYSVNTWDQGFLPKLYASTDAPGVASDLILSVLNTNVHVYDASPALTIIEKATARALASLFGFTGPHAGGISVPGGSASNTTSIVIARNTLFPSTKKKGNTTHAFILFTSAHGHYSVEKAAQMLGFGSDAVWTVPVVDRTSGRMNASALESLIAKARKEGKTPFYVNVTAGTTVLGSYDPIRAIAKICRENKLWLHVDASWGGPAIFSPELAESRLDGTHLADSIAINPHKMMGVPVTCSFLLGADLRQFHKANTLPASYLFHSDNNDSNSNPDIVGAGAQPQSSKTQQHPSEIHDLADLTLQCGRRGDALKLHLSWSYHGTAGYRTQIEEAFATAAYFSNVVARHPDLCLVSEDPPPCLQ
ncbi:MAG: hypothetical protein Q9212_006829, partial [Teloschistes hypoglaucus]